MYAVLGSISATTLEALSSLSFIPVCTMEFKYFTIFVFIIQQAKYLFSDMVLTSYAVTCQNIEYDFFFLVFISISTTNFFLLKYIIFPSFQMEFFCG